MSSRPKAPPKETLEIRVERWPFVQVPSMLVIDPAVKDGAVRTYAALALWGGVDGRAYPSKTKLAKARGMSVSTLFSHLAQLENAGWIRRWTEQHGHKELHVMHVLTTRSGPTLQKSGHPPSGFPDTPPPDFRRQKENLEREPGKSDVRGARTTPAPPRRRDSRDLADELAEIYPHGWTSAGNKRSPGLKQSAAAITGALAKGWTFEEIADGMSRYAKAIVNTRDHEFAPQMFRWINREGWREIPEQFDATPRQTRSPEEIAQAAKRASELDEDAKLKAIEEAAKWASQRRDAGSAINSIAQKHASPDARERNARPRR